MVLIMLRGKVHTELSQTGESSVRLKIKALVMSDNGVSKKIYP